MLHLDPGLQPERTSLAWSRTALAIVIVASLFLRWAPDHGWFTFLLVFASLVFAIVISATQKIRYRRATHGITAERIQADIAAIAGTTGSVLALSGLGIYAVVAL